MALSLEKRSELALDSLKVSLQKVADRGIDPGEISAQVKLVIDHSGSMEFPENQFYTRGDVQDLAERVLALSLSGLDADGSVQIYPFDTLAYDAFAVTQQNYPGAIEKWHHKRRQQMGGTNYLTVIDRIVAVAEQTGELEPGQPPVLVVFQTDGQTSNAEAVKRRLVQLAARPIFWQFIGLGSNTGFLKVLDDLPGRIVDNVGAFGGRNVRDLDEAGFYDSLTGEFVSSWIPAARAAGVLKDQR